MRNPTDPAAAVAWLRTPQAIRARCAQVFAAGQAGTLRHFRIDQDRIGPAADFVVETIRANYPDLEIPYHSRWRHFAVGGRDRWARLAGGLGNLPRDEIARIRFDLAVTSVLLDAGAGPDWCYREEGEAYARSEGLAVASFHLFADGVLSSRPEEPLRADADALGALTPGRLARAFQVGTDNPLVGLDGRAGLLARLADALRARPDLFGGDRARVGGLYDTLAGQAEGGRLSAAQVLSAVLAGFGPIWPGRIEVAGVNLGDVWRHPAARSTDPSDGLVPFHKLSQWLTYSLIEPLEEAGLVITDVDALTGLPEYRNGGLLVDLGVLVPRHGEVLGRPHGVDAEVVVEWRALTVALLDRLADDIRARLGLDPAAFPLAKILEGGTWAAGRRIARQRRADGGPPIAVVSDGTVF